MPPYQELNDTDVLNQVRDLVRKNKTIWTGHVKEKMAERKIDSGEIKECLLKGRFTEKPHLPNSFGQIEYKFQMGACIDGEELLVVASLIPEDAVVLITAYYASNR